jgi:hypothetical protein
MSDERKTLEQRATMTDIERLRHSASHVLATASVVGKPDDFASAHLHMGAPFDGVNGSIRTDRHAGWKRKLLVRQRDVLVRMREGDFLHVTATWN